MPWTRRQVRFLLSKGSPLTAGEREKMLGELHQDPDLGHAQKVNALAAKPPAKPARKK